MLTIPHGLDSRLTDGGEAVSRNVHTLSSETLLCLKNAVFWHVTWRGS
jgi:hypothetical protein